MTRSLVLLACSCLLSGVVVAQKTFRDAEREFSKAFKSPKTKTRLAAIDTFAKAGDPQVAAALLERLGGHQKEVDKRRARYDRITAELKEARAKWIDSRVRNGKIAQAALQQAQKKLEPLEKELAELDEALEGATEVERRLIAGVGDAVAVLEPVARTEASALLTKELTRTRKPAPRAVVLRGLGRVDHPMIRAALVEEVAASPIPALRVAALDALGRHPAEDSQRAALHALDDESWTVRSAALALLSVTGGKAAVPRLIDALEKEDGRLISDVMATLRALTKVDYHDNVTLWREWWTKHESGFTGFGRDAKAPGAVAPTGATAARKGAYFYGIETRSKHIIFVLDISGSMSWAPDAHWSTQQQQAGMPQPSPAPAGKQKIDFAKRELIQAISALPEDATFNVITFASEMQVWQKKMQTAKTSKKAAVKRWIQSLSADGATNLWDALERAFAIAGRGTFDRGYSLAADTIFILSDGDPNRGRITDKDQILREVKELNRLRKLAVHCVGVGPSETVDYIAFLARLARQNGGQFVLQKR